MPTDGVDEVVTKVVSGKKYSPIEIAESKWMVNYVNAMVQKNNGSIPKDVKAAAKKWKDNFLKAMVEQRRLLPQA